VKRLWRGCEEALERLWRGSGEALRDSERLLLSILERLFSV